MGGYQYGNHRQPFIGYLRLCTTTNYACSPEQHPIDLGTNKSGDDAIEEWGDLFLNFVNEGFSFDAPGRARFKWTK